MPLPFCQLLLKQIRQLSFLGTTLSSPPLLMGISSPPLIINLCGCAHVVCCVHVWCVHVNVYVIFYFVQCPDLMCVPFYFCMYCGVQSCKENKPYYLPNSKLFHSLGLIFSQSHSLIHSGLSELENGALEKVAKMNTWCGSQFDFKSSGSDEEPFCHSFWSALIDLDKVINCARSLHEWFNKCHLQHCFPIACDTLMYCSKSQQLTQQPLSSQKNKLHFPQLSHDSFTHAAPVCACRSLVEQWEDAVLWRWLRGQLHTLLLGWRLVWCWRHSLHCWGSCCCRCSLGEKLKHSLWEMKLEPCILTTQNTSWTGKWNIYLDLALSELPSSFE